MSVPAYPAYKDSGVEWIGEVPETWEIRRMSQVASVINGFPFNSALFDNSEGTPLVRIRDLGASATEARFRGEIVEAALITNTDVLIGMDGDFNVGRWKGEGVALLNQRMCCLRGADDLILFLEYALPYPLKLINDVTYATTVKHLSAGQVRDVRIALPKTRKERQAIITFLDQETGKIDALVAEQERLMALLKEKRQAVISQAVTKGLNPNAPMKPSGVEWLGEVPEGWSIVPLNRITQDKCDGPFGSGLKSEHYTDEGVRVIRLQNIRMGYFDGSDAAFIAPSYYEAALLGHDVRGGDLLIAGLGDDRNTVGRACAAPKGIEPAIVKADCFRFRLDPQRGLPDFIAMQLTSGSGYDAGILSSGSTRSRIPLSVMATRMVALPSIREQAKIVEFIESETAKLDALTAEASQGINLLKERRAALISAAVTGKIDVRGLAASVQEAA